MNKQLCAAIQRPSYICSDFLFQYCKFSMLSISFLLQKLQYPDSSVQVLQVQAFVLNESYPCILLIIFVMKSSDSIHNLI